MAVKSGPIRDGVTLGKSVERGGRLDLVAADGGQHEGQQPAHAEADHTDAATRDGIVAVQEIDGTRHVTGGPVGWEVVHQLPRLVHLVVPGEFTVVQVGGERHQAVFGQHVGHALDLGVETPPLLNDDHAWP